ncbi:elongator complex protein [Cystoisospora suis]|uniref:Elongator complex protein n=1 Tax=Cystoisospora suis TaxID=483139 RepID=A0A2C6KT63_9APIC|nr:elongator complex protein [Cystoisospora suis]
MRPDVDEWGDEENSDIPFRRPPLLSLPLSTDARPVSPPTLLAALTSRTRSLASGPSRSLSTLFPSRFTATYSSSGAAGHCVPPVKSGTSPGLRKENAKGVVQPENESVVGEGAKDQLQLSSHSESRNSAELPKPYRASCMPSQKSPQSDTSSPERPLKQRNTDVLVPERSGRESSSFGEEASFGIYGSSSCFRGHNPASAAGVSFSESEEKLARNGRKGKDEVANVKDRSDQRLKVGDAGHNSEVCVSQSSSSRSTSECPRISSNASAGHLDTIAATLPGGTVAPCRGEASKNGRVVGASLKVPKEKPKQKEGRFSLMQVLSFRPSASGTPAAGSSSSSSATYSTSSTSSLTSCSSSVASSRSSPSRGSSFPTPTSFPKASRPVVSTPTSDLSKTQKDSDDNGDDSSVSQGLRLEAFQERKATDLLPSVPRSREHLDKKGKTVFSSRTAKRSRSVDTGNTCRGVSTRVAKRVARASSRGINRDFAGETNDSCDLNIRGKIGSLGGKSMVRHEDVLVSRPETAKSNESDRNSGTLAIPPFSVDCPQGDVPDTACPDGRLRKTQHNETRPFSWLYAVQGISRMNSYTGGAKNPLSKSRETGVDSTTDRDVRKGAGSKKPVIFGVNPGVQAPTSAFMGLFRSSSAPLHAGPQTCTSSPTEKTQPDAVAPATVTPVGLSNMTNTCFMNAALQSLAGIPGFPDALYRRLTEASLFLATQKAKEAAERAEDAAQKAARVAGISSECKPPGLSPEPPWAGVRWRPSSSRSLPEMKREKPPEMQLTLAETRSGEKHATSVQVERHGSLQAAVTHSDEGISVPSGNRSGGRHNAVLSQRETDKEMDTEGTSGRGCAQRRLSSEHDSCMYANISDLKLPASFVMEEKEENPLFSGGASDLENRPPTGQKILTNERGVLPRTGGAKEETLVVTDIERLEGATVRPVKENCSTFTPDVAVNNPSVCTETSLVQGQNRLAETCASKATRSCPENRSRQLFCSLASAREKTEGTHECNTDAPTSEGVTMTKRDGEELDLFHANYIGEDCGKKEPPDFDLIQLNNQRETGDKNGKERLQPQTQDRAKDIPFNSEELVSCLSMAAKRGNSDGAFQASFGSGEQQSLEIRRYTESFSPGTLGNLIGSTMPVTKADFSPAPMQAHAATFKPGVTGGSGGTPERLDIGKSIFSFSGGVEERVPCKVQNGNLKARMSRAVSAPCRRTSDASTALTAASGHCLLTGGLTPTEDSVDADLVAEQVDSAGQKPGTHRLVKEESGEISSLFHYCDSDRTRTSIPRSANPHDTGEKDVGEQRTEDGRAELSPHGEIGVNTRWNIRNTDKETGTIFLYPREDSNGDKTAIQKELSDEVAEKPHGRGASPKRQGHGEDEEGYISPISHSRSRSPITTEQDGTRLSTHVPPEDPLPGPPRDSLGGEMKSLRPQTPPSARSAIYRASLTFSGAERFRPAAAEANGMGETDAESGLQASCVLSSYSGDKGTENIPSVENAGAERQQERGLWDFSTARESRQRQGEDGQAGSPSNRRDKEPGGGIPSLKDDQLEPGEGRKYEARGTSSFIQSRVGCAYESTGDTQGPNSLERTTSVQDSTGVALDRLRATNAKVSGKETKRPHIREGNYNEEREGAPGHTDDVTVAEGKREKAKENVGTTEPGAVSDVKRAPGGDLTKRLRAKDSSVEGKARGDEGKYAGFLRPSTAIKEGELTKEVCAILLQLTRHPASALFSSRSVPLFGTDKHLPPPHSPDIPSMTAQRPRHSPPTATSRAPAESVPELSTAVSSVVSSPPPSSRSLLPTCQTPSAVTHATACPCSPRNPIPGTAVPQKVSNCTRLSTSGVNETGAMNMLSVQSSPTASSTPQSSVGPGASSLVPASSFCTLDSAALSLPPSRRSTLPGNRSLVVVTPDKLRDLLAVHAPGLLYVHRQEQAQQDCHEFLRLLIDKMHEELRRLPHSVQQESQVVNPGVPETSCNEAANVSPPCTSNGTTEQLHEPREEIASATVAKSRSFHASQYSSCRSSWTTPGLRQKCNDETTLESVAQLGSAALNTGYDTRKGRSESVSLLALFSSEKESTSGTCTTTASRSDSCLNGTDSGAGEPQQVCEVKELFTGEKARNQGGKGERLENYDRDQHGVKDAVVTPREGADNIREKKAAEGNALGDEGIRDKGSCRRTDTDRFLVHGREEDRSESGDGMGGGREKSGRGDQPLSNQKDISTNGKTPELLPTRPGVSKSCRKLVSPGDSRSGKGKTGQLRREAIGDVKSGEKCNSGTSERAEDTHRTILDVQDHDIRNKTEREGFQDNGAPWPMDGTRYVHSEEPGGVAVAGTNLKRKKGGEAVAETGKDAFRQHSAAKTGERCMSEDHEDHAGFSLASLPEHPSSQYRALLGYVALEKGEEEQKVESFPWTGLHKLTAGTETKVPGCGPLREVKIVQGEDGESKVERTSHNLRAPATFAVNSTNREEAVKSDAEERTKAGFSACASGGTVDSTQVTKEPTSTDRNTGSLDHTQFPVGATASPKTGGGESGSSPGYEEIERAKERAETEWRAYMKEHETIMSQVFAGQLCSKITCLNCHNSLCVYEPAWDLSLPLLPDGPRTSLSEELSKFFSSEYLDFRCERCEQKTTAERRFFYSHLPRVLLVHLKKFKPDGTKSHVRVAFPLRGLWVEEGDLPQFRSREHCTCCCDTSQEEQGRKERRRTRDKGEEEATDSGRETARTLSGPPASSRLPPLKGSKLRGVNGGFRDAVGGQKDQAGRGKTDLKRDAAEKRKSAMTQGETPECRESGDTGEGRRVSAEGRVSRGQAEKSQEEEDRAFDEKQHIGQPMPPVSLEDPPWGLQKDNELKCGSNKSAAEYRLLAVIVHTGQSGQAGHYVAFVRRFFSTSTMSLPLPDSSPHGTAATPGRAQQTCRGSSFSTMASAAPPTTLSAHGFLRARKSSEASEGTRRPVSACLCDPGACTKGEDREVPAPQTFCSQTAVTNVEAKVPRGKSATTIPSTSCTAAAPRSSRNDKSTPHRGVRALSVASSACRCKSCAELAEVSAGPPAESTSVSSTANKPLSGARRYSSLFVTEAKAGELPTEAGFMSSSHGQSTTSSSDKGPDVSDREDGRALCFLHRASSGRKSLSSREAETGDRKARYCQCSFCVNRGHGGTGQTLRGPQKSYGRTLSCLSGSSGSPSEAAGGFSFLPRTISRRSGENPGGSSDSRFPGTPWRCDCTSGAVGNSEGGTSQLEEEDFRSSLAPCTCKSSNACEADGRKRERSETLPKKEKEEDHTSYVEARRGITREQSDLPALR